LRVCTTKRPLHARDATVPNQRLVARQQPAADHRRKAGVTFGTASRLIGRCVFPCFGAARSCRGRVGACVRASSGRLSGAPPAWRAGARLPPFDARAADARQGGRMKVGSWKRTLLAGTLAVAALWPVATYAAPTDTVDPLGPGQPVSQFGFGGGGGGACFA